MGIFKMNDFSLDGNSVYYGVFFAYGIGFEIAKSAS